MTRTIKLGLFAGRNHKPLGAEEGDEASRAEVHFDRGVTICGQNGVADPSLADRAAPDRMKEHLELRVDGA